MVLSSSLFLNSSSSYNGPYTESNHDEAGRRHSHIHWSEEKKQDFHPTELTESPSAHRRPPPPLSHFIQSAIIPAGSTIHGLQANQLLTPSKEFTSISFPCK